MHGQRLFDTQARRLGHLSWSWSGNGGVEYLDMATGFDANQLTSWGQRIFSGANGIRETSREAPVFGGGGGGGIPPTAPGAPVASAITSGGATLRWAASADAVAVTAYDVVRSAGPPRRRSPRPRPRRRRCPA